MMKKSKLLILCAVLMAGTIFATGCSRDGNMNDTQAPYEDETNNNVNGGTNNGTTNGAADDLERSGNNLQDAGRNLVDSVEDAGGAIMDGVRDITGTNNNNTNNNVNNNTNNNTNNR